MGDVVTLTVSRDKCEPHPHNYNEHPSGQIASIRDSLVEFGQVQTVVVWPKADDLGYWILAGTGVWLACHPEGDWPGLDQLEARACPPDWSLAKALAYIAVDNETARYSNPDEAQLAAITKLIHNEDEALAQTIADSGRLDALLQIAANDQEALARLKEMTDEPLLVDHSGNGDEPEESPFDAESVGDDEGEEGEAWYEGDEDEEGESTGTGRTRDEKQYHFKFSLDFDDAVFLDQTLKQYTQDTGGDRSDWIVDVAGRFMCGEETGEAEKEAEVL